MSKRIQRPRLEQRQDSNVWGGFNKGEDAPYVGMSDDSSTSVASARLTLKDAKRLHAFLTKVIAYLEARK